MYNVQYNLTKLMVRLTCKAPAKWNEYMRIQVVHLSSLCGPECVNAARSGEVVAHDAHATRNSPCCSVPRFTSTLAT